ncbi:DUF7455 domain-containing protein [Lacisediminihabitans changchengi]|uniref:DUF7455 domain-containing protein n=1 Tax=Lacisediminihabitans changchengi TaxID=2787634 RepID=A0A934SK33_9MICO|nr:hypothetical protein [Lacisediminihabitans changchengi]MBK4346720.1 hypothetical protein [Lacisediminihabitans changchengi]MBK4348157.1 hypothetical protein [Lacisediminihabitans changchengi]
MSQIAPETTAVDLGSSHELTAADRCDSCGAQAYIRVAIGESELLFCAHHGKKYQEKLSTIASDWHDESARLLENK